MANLDPNTVLEWNNQNYQEIRRIETTDAVLGGNPTKPDPNNVGQVVMNSPINFALATLAARTKWLKKEVERVSGLSVPDKATQAEAEAGTNNEKFMTPLRTKEAIDELTPATLSRTKILSDLTVNNQHVWELNTTQQTTFRNAFQAGKDFFFIMTNSQYDGGATTTFAVFFNPYGVHTISSTTKRLKIPSTTINNLNESQMAQLQIQYSSSAVQIRYLAHGGNAMWVENNTRLDVWTIG